MRDLQTNEEGRTSARETTPGPWTVCTSHKQKREGEAFLKNGTKFVLKVYASGVPDPVAFAQYLAEQFNRMEAKRR